MTPQAAARDRIEAAGVVLRDGSGRVAVIHRPRRGDWSLPKGKLERGESHLVAAVRECHEETGAGAVLGPPLGARSYEVDGVPKTVQWWSARAVPGPFHAGREVDELRWVRPDEAGAVLTYPEDADLVRAAVALPPTTSLVVLRHAEAMKRAVWAATGAVDCDLDTARPLAPDGLLQADGLAEMLASYGVEQIVCSPSRRCRQTVGPYAAMAGIAVRQAYPVSEEGWLRDPADTQAFVRGVITDLSVPTVLCTHRPVLPLVLETLSAALQDVGPIAEGSPSAAGDPSVLDPRLPPAAAIVLHVAAAGVLVAAERHDPQPLPA